MDHDQIADLLGAFAVDALDQDESELVARHLDTCPRCTQEVDEHREAAAALAFAGETAPEGLWERIQSRLDEAPPEMDLAPIVPFRSRPPGPAAPRRPVFRAAALVAAAAAAVVIAVLGVQVADLRDRVSDLDHHQLPVVGPHAVAVSLRSPDGSMVVSAVVTADGSGYVAPGNLPGLPSGQTYQLWAITGGHPVSVGVLGPEMGLSTFKADGRIDNLAITAENAPGAATPNLPPVVIGAVPRTA